MDTSAGGVWDQTFDPLVSGQPSLISWATRALFLLSTFLLEVYFMCKYTESNVKTRVEFLVWKPFLIGKHTHARWSICNLLRRLYRLTCRRPLGHLIDDALSANQQWGWGKRVQSCQKNEWIDGWIGKKVRDRMRDGDGESARKEEE